MKPICGVKMKIRKMDMADMTIITEIMGMKHMITMDTTIDMADMTIMGIMHNIFLSFYHSLICVISRSHHRIL
jgi:hypothetical protein